MKEPTGSKAIVTERGAFSHVACLTFDEPVVHPLSELMPAELMVRGATTQDAALPRCSKPCPAKCSPTDSVRQR